MVNNLVPTGEGNGSPEGAAGKAVGLAEEREEAVTNRAEVNLRRLHAVEEQINHAPVKALRCLDACRGFPPLFAVNTVHP